MSVSEDVKGVLESALNISDREVSFDRDMALFGGLPEFDSMAVVTILTAIEEEFGCVIDDDEVDASIFETVGSLTDFVEQKVQS